MLTLLRADIMQLKSSFFSFVLTVYFYFPIKMGQNPHSPEA